MQVSAISSDQSRRNLFIEYANRYMSFKSSPDDEDSAKKPAVEAAKKADKSMGLETLTIFPKQIIDGKTVITA